MSIPGAPNSRRKTAFRWLVDILRNDATLAGIVDPEAGWYVREDGEADNPGADADLPATENWVVRLTPAYEPEEFAWSIAGRRVYRSPIAVTIETRRQGDSLDDRSDVWEAIERALSPRDPTVRRRMEAYAGTRGVDWWTPLQPGIAPGRDAVSAGRIRLMVHVPM